MANTDVKTWLHHWQDEADAAFLYLVLAGLRSSPNSAGEALIDEPVEAFPFAPCCRLTSCQGEIEAGIVASL